MKIAEGVQLTLIPTDKFKTVSIKISFKNTLSKEAMTHRSLLARLLERNSEEYPSQVDLQKALSKLYGASFGTSLSRYGSVHTLSLNMHIVNEKFVEDKSLTEQAVTFLKSVLLKPNASDQAFDAQTFKREKSNLKDDIESIYDDKQQYAKQQLLAQFFEDETQSLPLDGDLKQLEELTSQEVYQTYLNMLKEDEIDIVVLGDLDEAEVAELFESFNFEDRPELDSDLFYQGGYQDFKRQEEVQSVQQAKLNMAYQTDIRYLEEDYFALQVFNAIFGGFPGSKLFLNVREKESLAYYASSSIDSLRGGIYVQTGIDQKESDRVIDLIKDQHQEIIDGEFSEETLQQAKEMLKNGLRQSEDSTVGLMRLAYMRKLTNNAISIDEWIDRIMAVDKEAVINVAQNLSLQSIFILRGED